MYFVCVHTHTQLFNHTSPRVVITPHFFRIFPPLFFVYHFALCARWPESLDSVASASEHATVFIV